METITIVLVLLLAVVASGFTSRALPLPIPRPLVQIGFGVLIGLSTGLRVELDPEIFFLLFVPPLLFLDGWRIPNEDLLKDGKAIIHLALGLVVVTVVGIGFLVHWMIPSIPLAVAFALASVVSPTDPVAVAAIAERVRLPKRMVRILEGESLLNDASGLVCLRFATAAALTGTFSLSSASLNFAWLVSGGIAVGAFTTWITARTKDWITRRVGEESGSQIIISLLIPFAAYLMAERLHCSGILAAVSAGVTMSLVEASGQARALTRLHRNTIWDTVRFAGNGIIFVLLGEQMPAILAGARDTVRVTGHQNPWWLLIYVLAINIGVATLRFLWVWVSLNLANFRTHLRGAAARTPNWQLVAATSVAGVRGAVTLAGVLTLPLALNDGTPFPGRDLAIFLATGVIVVSLLAASIGLPLLLRRLGKATSPLNGAEEDRAGIAAAEAAIAEIERIQEDLTEGGKDGDAYLVTATLITERYRTRIAVRSQTGRAATLARRHEAIERRMWVVAIKAERTAIFGMLRASQIGSETAHKLVRELDLLEARYEGSP